MFLESKLFNREFEDVEIKWSKVKKLVENSFAESVRKRVKIYSTHYQCSCGRGWITIDGKELVDFSTMLSGNVYGYVYHETTKTVCAKHSAVKDEERTPNKLIEDGEFSRFDLHIACWDYLHQIVKDSLESENPLIKSLAVLNAKVGKRRLIEIAKQNLHPLTRALLDFRIEAERELRSRREIEIINANAEMLNKQALETLEYQADIWENYETN